MVAGLEYPVLVGDIGGTNSRFGLVRDVHSELELFEPVKTNDFPDMQSAIEAAVLAKTSAIPKRIVIGIAAPIAGDQYKLTNARWNVRPDEVVADLGLESAEFMNDFPAQALGVLAIERDDMHQVGGGKFHKTGTRVVLGPGTSFGVATLVHSASGWIILPGETACSDLAIGSALHSARELQIQPHLDRPNDRLTIDDMISGPGLENLYRAICLADGKPGDAPPSLSAAQISAAALEGEDKNAGEAVATFARLLGRVAGNVALLAIARGGVYVTGGMAHKMLKQIDGGGFRQEFENKPPQAELARSIPTYFVNRELAALEGLEIYVRTPNQFDLSHASAKFLRKPV